MKWLLPLTIIYLSSKTVAGTYRGISSRCSPVIWDAIVSKLHSLPAEFERNVCRRNCPVHITEPSSPYHQGNGMDDLFDHIIKPAIEEVYYFMAILDTKYPTPLSDLLHVGRLVTDIAESCAATYNIHSLCPVQQELLLQNQQSSGSETSRQFKKCLEDTAIPALVDRVAAFMPWLSKMCSKFTPEMVDRVWRRAVLGNMGEYGMECAKSVVGDYYFG
ncbi:hypothetical protein BGW36DRAFT_441005 [Talaromyces proteolyticus]|uniref:Saposin B-type domain-containing protein n=1 Tax=Talaromyces proteolyticus TaxID=1131652 RepID=A0AAD4KF31_9EURO|nr:uncharacterized protein BGW36DRAFT_441005 [Talaromyces proteolyticus]KAH8690134.1 hypothetical protein BGW36DRAFT_441005 [Talaromyces proteolyticus]